MSPRIQGGRPGPGSITFTVLIPSTMSSADVAQVGDTLGPYVWFDDTTGGLFCWADPGQIEAAYGPVQDWWEVLHSDLIAVGASPDDDYTQEPA